MRIEGSYTFNAPREVVWKTLMDIEVLSRAMPGCERLEQIGEDEYEATLNVKVGPVQGRFEGKVKLSDLNPPESYHMSISGRGAPGFASGEGDLRLEEQNGSTVLCYQGHGQVGGRIASVGQRLLDTSARALIRQGLEELHQQIRVRMEAAVSDEPIPEIETPSPAQFAVGVARGVLDEILPRERRPIVAVAVLSVLAILAFLLGRLR